MSVVLPHLGGPTTATKEGGGSTGVLSTSGTLCFLVCLSRARCTIRAVLFTAWKVLQFIRQVALSQRFYFVGGKTLTNRRQWQLIMLNLKGESFWIPLSRICINGILFLLLFPFLLFVELRSCFSFLVSPLRVLIHDYSIEM